MSTEAQGELVPPAKNEHVEKIEGALAKFSAVDAGLAALRERHNGVVFEVTTSKGLDLAKAARAEVREVRLGIEAVRKDAKAPILALGKKLDTEAARITKALEEIEGPIDSQIKAEETRKEREKQERVAIEVKRVADIQTRIAAIAALVLDTPGASIEKLDALIARADAAVADQGSFMEFQAQAAETYTSTRAKLLTARQAIEAQLAESARLKAEREELAKRKAEQDARDEEERARQAERDRQAQVDRDHAAAELKRQQDELTAQRAADEQARRDADAALEAKRADLERREAALRPPPPPEPAPAAPEPVLIDPDDMFTSEPPAEVTEPLCPTPGQILEFITAMYAVERSTALAWMRSIDWNTVEDA